eukprot:COSAG02_NODE_19944_length_856_cov_1.848085_1_plen_47_part_10
MAGGLAGWLCALCVCVCVFVCGEGAAPPAPVSVAAWVRSAFGGGSYF